MSFIQSFINSKTVERLKRKTLLLTGLHLKIKKLRPNVSTDLQTVKILSDLGINNVLDVGGNTGQFAEGLIDFGFKGSIISFEPVSTVHQKLVKRTNKHKQWEAYPICAIGEKKGQAEINVSQDSVFSSLLTIKNTHVESKPGSRIVKKEMVKIRTIDEVMAEKKLNPQSTLLKIDTQGFEKNVLEGSKETIEKGLKAIKIEIPLHEIYQNTNWGFDEIMTFMKNNDYKLIALNVESVDPKTGYTNTLDGVFVKL